MTGNERGIDSFIRATTTITEHHERMCQLAEDQTEDADAQKGELTRFAQELQEFFEKRLLMQLAGAV